MLSGQVVTLRHRKRKGGGKSQHHERQDRRAWTTRKHNGASRLPARGGAARAAERHDAACAAQQPGQDDAMVAVEAREYLPADVRTSRASVTTGVRASIKKRATAFPADESTIWKGTDNLERNRLIQEKQTAQCKGRLHWFTANTLWLEGTPALFARGGVLQKGAMDAARCPLPPFPSF